MKEEHDTTPGLACKGASFRGGHLTVQLTASHKALRLQPAPNTDSKVLKLHSSCALFAPTPISKMQWCFDPGAESHE